jgi:hypothetical protein
MNKKAPTTIGLFDPIKSQKTILSNMRAPFAALSIFLALIATALYPASLASSAGSIGVSSLPGPAASARAGGKGAAPAARRAGNASKTTPQRADETVIEAGNLNIERRGHTATKLADGRVLIVGGENENGAVQQAEVFDRNSRSFSLTARLNAPRTDHTATSLAGGRVLIAGGRNRADLVDKTEIFDPATGAFTEGPALLRARAGHTATVLADGRILIAGGDMEGSAELFDPATGRFSLIAGRMAGGRYNHSAVLLANGKVLIAGGLAADGKSVQTGEVFDPETMQFSKTRNPMRGARTKPALSLLPDGKVQVIGGDQDRSMEMFNAEGGYFTAYARLAEGAGSRTGLAATLRAHTRAALIHRSEAGALMLERSRAALLEDTLVQSGPEGSMFDRSDHTLTDIPESGEAIVAGGISSAGKVLTSTVMFSSSTATVTTDNTDYAPGQTVTITGTGWHPGETVELRLHRDNDTGDTLLSAVADADGNIVNSDYVCQDSDLGVTFLLTATGLTSGYTAQTTFTDGVAELSITSPTTASPVTITSLPASVTISFSYRTNGTGGTINAVASVKSGSTVIASNSKVIARSNGPLASESVVVGIPTGTPDGSYTAEVSVSNPGGTGNPPSLTDSEADAIIISTATAPEITCPGDITRDNDPGQCSASVEFSATATGTPEPAVGCSPASGSSFPVGTTTVTCTATNSAGSDTCTFNVTVNDSAAPVITGCPSDITVQTGAGATTCSATASWTAPTATDNCAVDTFTSSHNPGDAFPLATTTVTYTAKDAAGNETICSFTVTVVDDTPPVATCPAGTTASADAACQAAIPNVISGVVASDNCTPSGSLTIAQAPAAGEMVGLGVHTITVTVTDAANNSITCTTTFTVNDTTPPAISCPPDMTVGTNTGCAFSGPIGNATATDNCDGSVMISNNAPAPFPLGSTTVTWTATDDAGNSSTCTQVVTVVDDDAPTITCPPGASALVGTGCVAAVPDFRGLATVADNCAVSSVTQAPAPGALVGPGVHIITLTVTDAANNSASCNTTTFTVTNDPPVIATVTGPSGPIALGNSATVTVSFTDSSVQGHTAIFSWDDGTMDTSVPLAPGATTGSAAHTYASAGVFAVKVTVMDDCGEASQVYSYEFIVVYDPNGGFVTGGGWINSPAGAYVVDPYLTGRANFGFVSKYKRGQSVPDGQTQFQFQAGNLNFHSTAYQWLVIAGAKAQYKGTGTINGSGSYGFLLTATDGQANGGGGTDKFRIKIWNMNNNDAIVYDNRLGSSDDIDSANPQALGGGSIVIHK